ncbi:hypothetical protein XELAEV_18009573mg [Xenopus laevis]|uniref:Secreted protein n=1 Tax=Xenopus laevis TaxID=8355 RepID=A0A974DST4_XENLA|nr:hypothetical protein XELAEV_18009573mg [Xenopus laevis]
MSSAVSSSVSTTLLCSCVMALILSSIATILSPMPAMESCTEFERQAKSLAMDCFSIKNMCFMLSCVSSWSEAGMFSRESVSEL